MKLPEDDDVGRRSADLQEQVKEYGYNYDAGLPLARKASKLDDNRPAWTLELVRTLFLMRKNLQKAVEKSGVTFMSDAPRRDIPELIRILKTGGDVVSYFVPDLGFVKSGDIRSSDAILAEYSDVVFANRGRLNNGIGDLPDIFAGWESDDSFAFTFIGGPNANIIEKINDTVQADVDFSKIDFQGISKLAGDSFATARQEGRVFMVDHRDMDFLFNSKAPGGNANVRSFDGVRGDDTRYCYNPIAFFVVAKSDKTLVPVGIQCGRKSEGHAMYTPKDGYSWRMAKHCVLAAHNNQHEVISHLALTHWLIDPIIVATRIRLHHDHPVYQLLSPHFEGTIPINIGARNTLVAVEGSVDRMIGSALEKNYEYITKERLNYSFRDNFLKTRLSKRGTLDSYSIHHYPYREDALLVWNAIHKFVTNFVDIWYKTDSQVQSDSEIQSWASEIINKGQVKDFTIDSSGISGKAELIDILTMIIFTTGPQHAAVNFSQGSDMTFLPANPLAGYAPAPQGFNHTVDDYLKIVPPVDVALVQWNILTLLSSVNVTRLGDLGSVFKGHALSKRAVNSFSKDLQAIETAINAKNQSRKRILGRSYVHLLPSRIPASINI